MKYKNRKGKEKLNTEEKVILNRKKIFCITGAISGCILLIYIIGAIYFTNHFFINTKVNGQDISGKSIEKAEKILNQKVQEYVLVIREKNSDEEKITGDEISLTSNLVPEITDALKKQNTWLWFMCLFQENLINEEIIASYNKQELEKAINSLKVMTENQQEVRSAYPKFNGEQFIIESEVYGLEQEILKESITLAILKLNPILNLEEAGCYKEPTYTKNSEEVTQACEKMNKYCQSSITYTMGNDVVLDKKIIATWLSVDENMNVIIDEKSIKEWLENLGEQYDTQGSTRNFITPTGKSATVTGGTYGWSIDEVTEFTSILETIKTGEVIEKEPAYYVGGTAAVHGMPDWGNTYIEVDLSEQHMWYIIDSNIVLETDVVTGEPIPEKITPEGVYTILEKSTDTVLIGEPDPVTGEPIYETRVNYWMRVTWEGIGFHDATWQSAFGGQLYQIHNVGSHGCINMPLDQAGILYSKIEQGTPVIIHY